MATLFDTGIFSIVGLDSAIDPGATLTWYLAGTSTTTNTYSDAATTVPNSNPVVAGADGRFGAIWLDAGDYKYVLKSSAGTVLVTRDDYAVAAEPVETAAALDDFLAGTAALPIANGGTASTSAVNALTALGALGLVGGTVTGNITRSTKGVHHYWETAAMASGRWFLTATGDPDPRTPLPGEVWLRY